MNVVGLIIPRRWSAGPTLRSRFDPAGVQARLIELEKAMLEPAFWDDQEKAASLQRENKRLLQRMEDIREMDGLLENCELVCELLSIGELSTEGEDLFVEMLDKLEILEVDTLLAGEYDASNAFLSIQAGTGGLDAQDWAQMLMRMYLRYFDKQGWKATLVDLIEDNEAGIKHVTIEVEGDYAFGMLRSERGVHRLVRISPFNTSGKRQTSFAAVDVMPEIDSDVDVDINDDDLKIDTYRSGGHGGQSVNTTDSAVRITHLPTGIVVQCQNERSQLDNKTFAMKVLRSKLYELRLEEEQARIKGIKGDSADNTWGSQIRSYVLNPYNMVKDHRTSEETGNVDAVLDGAIDSFIQAYLKENR